MIKILQGDAIEKMRELPDECVHCCVTSPPYYGLRSYLAADDPDKASEIGAEQTPEQYVARMVEVFREVRRVLRNDGTLWLNLGDSYAANRSYQVPSTKGGPKHSPAQSGQTANRVPDGLKSKDLIGIPWRVAFALQADGWYLRAAIPWIKRNGMPESVRDRPSQVIEHIFMLTKSQRCFYDSEAVKMPLSASFANDKRHQTGSTDKNEKEGYAENGVQNPKKLHKMFDKEKPAGRVRRTRDWFIESWQGLLTDEDGDPLAFVVNTVNYKGSHFATFPPKLIEPCILASTSAHGCCSVCEAPWERVVERGAPKRDWRETDTPRTMPNGNSVRSEGIAPNVQEQSRPVTTVGWKPTCECNVEVEPCVVLDPFGGSGTTGQVAQQHGRNAVLIELNSNCISLIEQRTGVAA